MEFKVNNGLDFRFCYDFIEIIKIRPTRYYINGNEVTFEEFDIINSSALRDDACVYYEGKAI